MILTIVFAPGATRALKLAAARREISVEDYVKRAACEGFCAVEFASNAESEPEIAEMFLRGEGQPS